MARAKPFTTQQRTRLFDWRGAIVESDLPPMTTLVALVLSLHMNRAGESCFPGTPLLMRQTRLGRSAVLEHIKTLIGLGWLEAEKEHGRGAPRRYVARFPEGVVAAIIAGARAPDEPSATADSLPAEHEPSTNRPPTVRPGGRPLPSEDERTVEDVKQQPSPAEPAADTWLTPYLDVYKAKVGAVTAKGKVNPGRLAASLKPVHDEAGADKALALFTRWCTSDKSGYGPEWFAANWKKADRPAPGKRAAPPTSYDQSGNDAATRALEAQA